MTSAPPAEAPPAPFSAPGYVDLRALEFVREQPAEMPALEVVRLATGLGLHLDISMVFQEREKEKAKRRIVKPKESTMTETEASPAEATAEDALAAAPPVQKARRGRPPKGEETKAGFVRGLPADLSAKEVVEQAKAKGLELSEAYVYAVRAKLAKPAEVPKKRGRKPKGTAQAKEQEKPSELKKKGRKPEEAPPAQEVVPAAVPAKAPLFTRPPEETAQEVEVEFAKLALEIGLVRSDQLLRQLKSKLTEMLRS